MLNSKLIFIIAFIAVLTGLYGVADKLLSSPEAVVMPVSDDEAPITYTLWQVKKNMEKGTFLTLRDLKRVQLGQKEAQALGFNADVDLKLDTQTLTNTALNTDQYLLPELLSHPGDLGYLSLIAREGMTLYPLTVATKNLINNYILPGDDIDILVVSSPEHNLATDTHRIEDFIGLKASLLMRKVRVISIGESESGGAAPKVKSSNKEETRMVIEVAPDDLARLTLAQRTMHIEVHPSQHYGSNPEADVSDVITNYTGVVELRGASKSNVGGIF
ncbi:RcpC/CpaB family pilus assembly protein [Shewanella sp. YLB-07]|uniref:RcpC/CpaB family pilus assembly protein n=1 Tax=Shewanella sp. YLB-07 TaxID=2601268 RepID=UPI00128E4F84|nr:RcpC/CpaB family pilus assembly protein [Shewanella sp. YLB-07]MPY26132.1 pilus assembly protein CpaB [Shewanella sp. YLB-07]